MEQFGASSEKENAQHSKLKPNPIYSNNMAYVILESIDYPCKVIFWRHENLGRLDKWFDKFKQIENVIGLSIGTHVVTLLSVRSYI